MRYVKTAGGRLAYAHEGTGPAVLCLPSGGELQSQYRFLRPLLLTAGFSVISMDLRGQGASSAFWRSYKVADLGADALKVLDTVGVADATIIGASISAATALWIAGNHPDRTRSICTVAAYARAPQWWRARLLHPLILAPIWAHAAVARYYPSLYPCGMPADYSEHWQSVASMLREPGRMTALRRLFSNTGEDWDPAISRIRVPVQIAVGAHDPDFPDPEATAHALASRISAPAEVDVFERSGHNPHVDAPEEFAARFLEFQARHKTCATLDIR